MLTKEEFDKWCRQLQLAKSTRQLITQIRTSPPSRRVQGNYGNVCGNYCSEKMGQTIQFESHRGELAHIIDKLEHNPEVLEYYDQPLPIELNYLSKSGRKVRTSHTPDFFVLELNWAGWEEYKPQTELEKKAEKQPNRYVHNQQGHWFCPPGEEYAQKYGLGYRFRTDAELNTIRFRNWTWLEPYFQGKDSFGNSPLKQNILSLVHDLPGITYSELLLANEGITPDDINRLIASEDLFINFNTVPLAEPNQVRLFWSREQASAYEQMRLSESEESKQDPVIKEVENLLLKARPQDLETANGRYEAIKPYLTENPPPITQVSRSVRPWRQQYQEAQKLYGENHGYVGLLPIGGKREIRRLEYDQTFLILTLPSPQSGDTRIVQPGRGVKINHIYYWCHAFRDPEVEKTAVEVKIDPFNVSVAYGYVKGRWHECTSNHYSYLQGRTEKELQVISADLRQRKRHQGLRTVLSNRELVEHLQGAYQVEEKLLKQRLQALENQTVLDLIEGKQLSSNSLQVTHQDELKNDSFVLWGKTNDDETLESYGEF